MQKMRLHFFNQQSKWTRNLTIFFPFQVRKGSWLFHLTLVMDHGVLRMSFHVSIKQQLTFIHGHYYIIPYSHIVWHHFCLIFSLQSPEQMHATLLDFQCTSICTPCCMLLHVVGCCCAKFETSQTFKPATPQHSYLFHDCWSIAQQCWSCLHSLSKIVGDTHVRYTWSPKSYGLYPSHDALQLPTLLGVVASICTMLGAVASVCT